MFLLLKLLLAPSLVALASMAARRWGPAVGGRIAALPFVAGPVLLVVALERGSVFAAEAAHCAILGLVSLAAYSLCYAWVAQRLPWWASMLLGWAAYLATAAGLVERSGPLALVLPATAAAILLARWALPRPTTQDVSAQTPRWWDLPARAVAAGTLVLSISAVARLAGPAWSGILTPFPVATTILTVFAHSASGPATATELLRGFLPSLLTLALFFAALSVLLPAVSLLAAFVGALATTLPAHGLLWAQRAWSLRPRGAALLE